MRLEELKKGRWEVLPGPVLRPSANGWDSHSSMTPVVFRNADVGLAMSAKYGMLYIGSGRGSSSWGVGFATSSDLFSWTRHRGNPVLMQTDGSGLQLDAPCLVRSQEGYTLICEEKRVPEGAATVLRELLSPGTKRVLRQIRRMFGLERPTVVNHAFGRYFVSFSSKDIFNWDRKSKKVIFGKGCEGAFDAEGVFSPQVYRFGRDYHLFYGGTDGLKAYTGLAISRSLGSRWNRASIKPVLSPGSRGEWDEVNALIVSVMKLDDVYCAFYEGEDNKRRYSIGMAWSEDLLNWTKWEGNPVIMPGRAPYCEHMVCGPRVFAEDNELFLFFNAHGRDMRGACGMAVFRRGR
jgi:hypothetical protein